MTGRAATAPRVLVVAPEEPWPLSHGGHLRLHHFLGELANFLDVTLALPHRPEHAGQLPGVSVVRMEGGARATGGSRRRRSLSLRAAGAYFGHSPATASWLAANADPGEFDVAMLFGPLVGQYIDDIRLPVVWDLVDELVLYAARNLAAQPLRAWPAIGRAAVLYAAFERYVAGRSAATVLASPVDSSYLRRWAGEAAVTTISNGVDFDYFRPAEQPPEPGTLAFVGALDFPPNVEGVGRFVRQVWPLLHATCGARRLLVVGRRPTPMVRELAGEAGVELHADVPDVRPYLERAAVVIVPTDLGGGVKNKVLEGCAVRRPVVASPRALGGLSARRGLDVICATDVESWVGQVRRLLAEPARAMVVADNGARWVRRAHDWPTLAQLLRNVLVAAAGRGRRKQDRPPAAASPVIQRALLPAPKRAEEPAECLMEHV